MPHAPASAARMAMNRVAWLAALVVGALPGCRAEAPGQAAKTAPADSGTRGDSARAPDADTDGDVDSDTDADADSTGDSGEDTAPSEPVPRFRQVAVRDNWINVLCGDGSVDVHSVVDHHVALPEGHYRQISADGVDSTLCGLTDDGEIVCVSNAPTEYGMTEPPAGPFEAIAVESWYGCGLHRDATVECWGYDFGHGSADPPAGAFTVLDVCGTCALAVKADGQLAFWGDTGGFCDGLTEPPEGAYASVSVGTNSACALDSAGRATCWGSCIYHGCEAELTPPELAFVQVASGGGLNMGLEVSGVASCWGDCDEMNPPPLLFRSIDTDIYDACGITLDDTLVCWGSKYGSDFGAGTLIDDVCH